MLLYNPTHERFEIQHDSVMYDFKPKSTVEVPEWPKSIGESLLRRTYSFGIYEFKPEMTEEQRATAEKDGLKRFLEGYLSNKERNYISYQDSLQQAGKTVSSDYNFLKVQRDKKEISQFINYEEEKMGNASYLPKKEVKEKVKTV